MSAALFRVAELAAVELRAHLDGTAMLSPAAVEARKGFIRLASRRSFYFFAKVVLRFDKLTGSTHKKWAQDVVKAIGGGTHRLMRLKPRGTYKTTLYGVALPLYLWACYSPKLRIMYTSANQTLLDEVAAEMDRFIGPQSESLYRLVFGIARDPALKNTQDVFNIIGKEASKGHSLMFRTAGGSTNGVHPNLVIADDPMDLGDRSSPSVRKKKEQWFDSLTPLLVPFSLTRDDGRQVVIETIMVIATRWHLQDLVSYVLGKHGVDWDVETEGAYLEDGSVRYPELLPEAKLEQLRRAISEVFFACQYLNNPLPEGLRVFDLAKLHLMRPDQFDVTEGTNYCFLDPAKGKEEGDYAAVIWVNILNGRRVVFDAIDTKTELTALLGMIAAKNVLYRTQLMRFETNGAMGLESEVERFHRDARAPTMIEGVHEDRNKDERIHAMQPALYRQGLWYFRSDYDTVYPELMNQLLFYPAWGHRDFPDVIEKAVTWAAVNMPDVERFAAMSG